MIPLFVGFQAIPGGDRRISEPSTLSGSQKMEVESERFSSKTPNQLSWLFTVTSTLGIRKIVPVNGGKVGIFLSDALIYGRTNGTDGSSLFVFCFVVGGVVFVGRFWGRSWIPSLNFFLRISGAQVMNTSLSRVEEWCGNVAASSCRGHG